ncbi:AraC family transcriptional regulator [Lachnotalea glycerini]|uniref:AraC family transcriptional regulator n=2 Tax=Lachnotalea glycerini TaxID=1763509 RepID=A0A371JIN3_9FIRM|nr:AraC family transcriptional regulator [Lachnotalea glycerini]
MHKEGVAMTKEVVEVQTQYCSSIDIKKICSFDYEIIDEKTNPLYHQSPRFLYIKKGKGKMMVDTELYELKPDCLLSILPWDCTEIIEVEETLQYEIIKYNYDIVSNILKAINYQDAQEKPILKKFEESPVIFVREEIKEEILYLFDKLKKEVGVESLMEFPETQNYREIYIGTLLSELIVLFCREIDGQRQVPTTLARPDDKRSLLLRYIYMHLSEKITLDRISKQFYMSKSSISKYIMDKTGLSFNELINEMRVTKTVNYLLYTDFTLEELAPILGYVDAAHISKVFFSKMEDKIGNYRKTYQKVLNTAHVRENKQDYQIIKYISDNFTEEIAARSVADQFHISLIELNKILVIHLEKNFYEYLNLLRINKACELLIESDMSITDIAIEVGYNTVKTFRRNFVQLRHKTPGDFKKNTRIQE